MKFSKRISAIVAIVPMITMGGCASSLIDVTPGSFRVALADASQVGNCQSKGKITVSVLAEIGFINRSVESVEANLLQLARNGAMESGGDTVVKEESPEYGKRTFAIYKCHP
jgi:hypothetical protein